MNRRCALLLALAVALSPLGCGDEGQEEVEIGDDTLEVSVPEGAEERLEETGRRIGGAVGEAMEETGEAIERAGERVQEEVGEETEGP